MIFLNFYEQGLCLSQFTLRWKSVTFYPPFDPINKMSVSGTCISFCNFIRRNVTFKNAFTNYFRFSVTFYAKIDSSVAQFCRIPVTH